MMLLLTTAAGYGYPILAMVAAVPADWLIGQHSVKPWPPPRLRMARRTRQSRRGSLRRALVAQTRLDAVRALAPVRDQRAGCRMATARGTAMLMRASRSPAAVTAS